MTDRQGSFYDGDEGDWDDWYLRRHYNGGTGAGTSSDDAKKTRIKKSDIEAANVEQFMKWRTSLPVKNEITVIDDKFFEDSPLFGGVKTEKGMIDADSFKDMFNIILRAFVYVNLQRNNSEIVRMMDGYDISGSFEDERLQLLEKLFEECPLDKDFLANVVTKLYDISKSLTPDPTTSKFILPSEAVMSAFCDLMGDLDAFAYQSGTGIDHAGQNLDKGCAGFHFFFCIRTGENAADTDDGQGVAEFGLELADDGGGHVFHRCA